MVGDNDATLDGVVIGQNGATFTTGASMEITPPSELQVYTDATVEIVFTLGEVDNRSVINIFEDNGLSQSYLYKLNDTTLYHIDDGVFDKQTDNFDDTTRRIELPYDASEYYIVYRYNNDTLDVHVRITNITTGVSYDKYYTATQPSKLVDSNVIFIGGNSNNGLENIKEIAMSNRYLSDEELHLN